MWTRRLVRHLLVGVLIFALFPGASEVSENVVHLAAEGHVAHARPSGDKHSAPGPEHGCNGTYHLCSCHHSLSFLSDAAAPRVRRAAAAGFSRAFAASPLQAGFHYIPDKPPRV